MEIEDSYLEVRDMIEAVMLYIFRGLKEKRAQEIELVRSVYPSEEFLLPEPGKELRLTFAGKKYSKLSMILSGWVFGPLLLSIEQTPPKYVPARS